ncbi:hypothetical protein PDJAM_G00129270 [Pangasius djambal]|uniref:Uncharacterized protein n=1 Tax=Pangasius djambal TaxID=1691987 RepID=A0ACC5ZBZ6_9TELE|nr:hypothetical protein [Pangasius djambal]
MSHFTSGTGLCYTNSGVNPIIYTTFNFEFYKAFIKIEALPPKPAPPSNLTVSVLTAPPPPTDLTPPIFPSSLTIPPSLTASDLSPSTTPPLLTAPPPQRAPPRASTHPRALTIPSALSINPTSQNSFAITPLPLPLPPGGHALILNPTPILTPPSSSTSQSALETQPTLQQHLSGECLHPQQMIFDLSPNFDLHLDLDPPVGGADLCKGAADEESAVCVFRLWPACPSRLALISALIPFFIIVITIIVTVRFVSFPPKMRDNSASCDMKWNCSMTLHWSSRGLGTDCGRDCGSAGSVGVAGQSAVEGPARVWGGDNHPKLGHNRCPLLH